MFVITVSKTKIWCDEEASLLEDKEAKKAILSKGTEVGCIRRRS